jgi:hypothetical protein
MLVTRMSAFLILLVALAWSSSAWATPIEWTVTSGGNGHWYEAIDLGTAISWTDAQTLAEDAGGYLATITSAEEDAWVSANLLPLVTGTGGENRLGPWIGGYQDTSSPSYTEPAGGWTWVTGEPWDYTAWGVFGDGEFTEPGNGAVGGEPEDYLQYYLPGLSPWVGWNDMGIESYHDPVNSYIIEVVPEPSTALLLGMGMVGLAGQRKRLS